MRLSTAIAAAIAALLCAIPAAAQGAASPPRPGADIGSAVDGDILVAYDSASTSEERDRAAGRVGGVRRGLARPSGGRHVDVVTLRHESVATAIERLAADPAVAYAEPNWRATTTADANDRYYTSGMLYGMYGEATNPRNPFGVHAGEAWRAGHTGSRSVYVGVIDQGIQVNHKDLAANMWKNPFDPVNGRDDDANGYVDDVNGWDFANGDASVYDGGRKGTADVHGTHVMGTIGAEGGNREGVVGVNWAVTAISAKFMNADGGSTAAAIRALDYLTDLKTRHGLNIVATNNSYQFGGQSQALLDAITRAARADILYVAAAGNRGTDNDVTPSYPSNYDTTAGAGYDAVVAVAAINSAGMLPAFSQYGAQTVDLAAPGVDIYSTTPGNSYRLAGGTSMAAPHVTGAAALYASTHPASRAADIRQAILSSATPTESLAGRTVSGGRLDVSGF